MDFHLRVIALFFWNIEKTHNGKKALLMNLVNSYAFLITRVSLCMLIACI